MLLLSDTVGLSELEDILGKRAELFIRPRAGIVPQASEDGTTWISIYTGKIMAILRFIVPPNLLYF